MKDQRQFATGKMNKPMSSEGRELPVGPVIKEFNGALVFKKKRNPRRFLRPLLILLLFIEWLFDTAAKMWEALHNGIKDITLSIESYINEPDNTET